MQRFIWVINALSNTFVKRVVTSLFVVWHCEYMHS